MDDSTTDPLVRLSQARDFLEAAGPMFAAYRNGLFTYVAINYQGETIVLYARFELSVDARTPVKERLAGRNVFAGQLCITDLDRTAVEHSMRLSVTHQHLPPVHNLLLKLSPRSHAAPVSYDAHYDRSSLQQRRANNDGSVDRVLLGGMSRYELHSERLNELERELHEFGVDSFNQLMRIYGLTPGDQTTLEIATTPVAAFTNGCALSDGQASLAFRLAAPLDPGLLRIFIKNADPATSEFPRTIDGATIEWRPDGVWCQAALSVPLGEPVIVDCRLTYAGRPQAEMRLVDSKSLPNPRSLLVELVDPDAERLAQLIRAPEKEQGRDFEAACAWLLQPLGFDCLHIGAMSNLKEEPDILAAAPGGEVLIVECTTKVPDDDKVTKLISRAERMRDVRQRRLGSEPRASTMIVPILMCSRPPKELDGLREKASAHSIIVLCLPDLEQALAASQFAPNPTRQLRTWLDKPMTQLLTGERRLGVD